MTIPTGCIGDKTTFITSTFGLRFSTLKSVLKRDFVRWSIGKEGITAVWVASVTAYYHYTVLYTDASLMPRIHNLFVNLTLLEVQFTRFTNKTHFTRGSDVN